MLQSLHSDFDSPKQYVTDYTLILTLPNSVLQTLHSDFDSAKQYVTDSTLWLWLCQTVCYRLYTLNLTLPNSTLQTLNSDFYSVAEGTQEEMAADIVGHANSVRQVGPTITREILFGIGKIPIPVCIESYTHVSPLYWQQNRNPTAAKIRVFLWFWHIFTFVTEVCILVIYTELQIATLAEYFSGKCKFCNKRLQRRLPLVNGSGLHSRFSVYHGGITGYTPRSNAMCRAHMI